MPLRRRQTLIHAPPPSACTRCASTGLFVLHSLLTCWARVPRVSSTSRDQIEGRLPRRELADGVVPSMWGSMPSRICNCMLRPTLARSVSLGNGAAVVQSRGGLGWVHPPWCSAHASLGQPTFVSTQRHTPH